ncbi:MAG: hypothetical protein GPJ51_11405 [Candidatus Heimdallarchaeota archaeon]|nr:hypothetical protein [Candidatus Heimdallarchaeota archaeon]
MLKKKKELVFVLLVLMLIPNLISSAQAAENEDLVYLTDIVSNGGILESVPLIDRDGNLHTFLHVKNSQGNSLVHLYYLDEETHFEIIEEFAIGVKIQYSYSSDINIGIVYSVDNELGARYFYHYTWTEANQQTNEIFWISGEDISGQYVSFFKFQFIDRILHAFHNMWDHEDMIFMDIHYYRGFFTYDYDVFSIDAPVSGATNVMDITLDETERIWYVHRLDQQTFGIGTAILDNNTMYPQQTRTFSEVLYPVDKIELRENSNGLSYVFTNPSVLFWGMINSTHITENTITSFYENPVDSYYFDDGLNRSVIVAELVDNDYVNLYFYRYVSGQWTFSPINSIYHITEGFFSVYLTPTDYVVLYNITVSTDDYKPGTSLKYKEEEALGLIVLTTLSLDYTTYVDGLTIYNPIKEFFTKQWYIFLMAIAGVALLGVLIWLFIKRRGDEIGSILTDEQVGHHSKIVLILMNIWRIISNTFSTVSTIWFSNKKRSILTLAGFIITGYLLSSAVIIAQSEESAMIKAYDRSYPLFSDKTPSASLETSLQSNINGTSNVSASYGTNTEKEILNLYDGLEIEKYISGIQSSFWTNTMVYAPGYFTYLPYQFVSLPDTCDEFISTMLVEGRSPINNTEVVIAEQLASRIELGINGTLSLIASTDNPVDEENYLLSMTVVGIFSQINFAQVRRTAAHLGIPYDVYVLASENAFIITKQSIYFDILSKGGKMNLFVRGYFQLEMNFDEFNVAERNNIVIEQETLLGRVYSLTYDNSAIVRVNDEISEFFQSFNTYYLNNMARLLIFAIPAILLSIFMVFESSELFSTSYEQEMKILRSRGISTRRLFSIYLTIRIVEIIVASLLSFAIALGTAIPLIRINGFISFTNTDTHLVVGNVPSILGLVAGVLFIISIPRIIILVRRKKKIEKAPVVRRSSIKKIDKHTAKGVALKTIAKSQQDAARKGVKSGPDLTAPEVVAASVIIAFFVAIVKYKLITWRDVFFLSLGIGLLIYFYNQSFISYYNASISDFTLNLFLTIAGAIFTLLGSLPLIIKFLGLILRAVSVVVWKAKKSRFNFSIAEIGKDIKYFENITLIFLLVVLILIPVLVVPYSKETTLIEQSYFINGTDVRIENWASIDEISAEDIDEIAQVEDYTHVEVHTLYTGMFEHTRLVVVNTTSFLETVEKPADRVSNIQWNRIRQLDANTTIISEAMLEDFYKEIGDKYEFANPDVPWLRHSLTITGSFDLFPMYYFEGDYEEDEYMMIISIEAYEVLEDVLVRRLKTSDEMYIKTHNRKDAQSVVDKLFEKEQDMKVKTVEDVKDSLKTPLYNIFIIEMILSLFVALIVLMFSTFTTAIKILEKRVIKHDIMKKMGINPTKIINMSAIQTTVAAIIPALVLGAAGGIGVIYPTLKQLNYGTEQFSLYVNYPVFMLIAIFLGIPALIYLSLTYFLKREFAKYSPTMME